MSRTWKDNSWEVDYAELDSSPIDTGNVGEIENPEPVVNGKTEEDGKDFLKEDSVFDKLFTSVFGVIDSIFNRNPPKEPIIPAFVQFKTDLESSVNPWLEEIENNKAAWQDMQLAAEEMSKEIREEILANLQTYEEKLDGVLASLDSVDSTLTEAQEALKTAIAGDLTNLREETARLFDTQVGTAMSELVEQKAVNLRKAINDNELQALSEKIDSSNRDIEAERDRVANLVKAFNPDAPQSEINAEFQQINEHYNTLWDLQLTINDANGEFQRNQEVINRLLESWSGDVNTFISRQEEYNGIVDEILRNNSARLDVHDYLFSNIEKEIGAVQELAKQFRAFLDAQKDAAGEYYKLGEFQATTGDIINQISELEKSQGDKLADTISSTVEQIPRIIPFSEQVFRSSKHFAVSGSGLNLVAKRKGEWVGPVMVMTYTDSMDEGITKLESVTYGQNEDFSINLYRTKGTIVYYWVYSNELMKINLEAFTGEPYQMPNDSTVALPMEYTVQEDGVFSAIGRGYLVNSTYSAGSTGWVTLNGARVQGTYSRGAPLFGHERRGFSFSTSSEVAVKKGDKIGMKYWVKHDNPINRLISDVSMTIRFS